MKSGPTMTHTAEWQTEIIDDVSEKVGIGPFGSSIRVNTFVPKGIPIISGQHLNKLRIDEAPGFNFITLDHAQRLAKANVQRGDVVFTYAGNIGQVSYIPADSQFERYVISQRQFYMRCDRSKVIPEYVALYFKSPEGQHKLLANSSQVGVPMIARPVTYLRSIEIPVPPLPEQQAIAHILCTLDDKIELNRRMNRTLEEMARAVFKDWFVDFGPTRAKMEGLDPYLPPEVWDLFPDEIVGSELGEIPEGWSLRKFGDLLKDVIGGDWGKESPTPPDTEVVSIIRGTDIPNLRAGGTGSVPRRFTSERKANRRRLEEGDIVIEVSGGSPTTPTGRSMILTTDILERFDGTVVCASFCRRLRPSTWVEGLIASQHLDYLNSIEKMWEYQLQSTGISNFQTKRFLDEEQVIWPDPKIAKAFANVVSPIVKTTNRNENKTIAETRDALLPRLLSGQLATTGNEQTNKGHAR